MTLSRLIEMCALGMQVYAFLTVHKVKLLRITKLNHFKAI